jgi:phenylpropionate dioxygenase-like ring-hydroxylating dioxygenase large terminal subunit
MNRASDLPDLLAGIAAAAAAPPEAARTLPPEAYRSEALLELETDAIFARDWICAGRADEIPNPGDWLALDVAGEPLLVARGFDGEIRALSNVCRHRFMTLASGRGSSKSLQCPYHAWTYDLEGRLLGAPYMERTPAFRRADCRLPTFRTEVWNGFLYVNLDADAAPLAPRLEGLAKTFANHGLERMRTLVSGEEVWPANWKCLAENAMESYHVFRVHAHTLEPWTPTASIVVETGGPGYNLHRQAAREGSEAFGAGAPARALNPALSEFESRTFWLATVYPAQVIALFPTSVVWLAFQPRGVDEVHVRWGSARLAPAPTTDSPQGAALREAIRQGVDAVNAEDRATLASVQRGVRARAAAQGFLSELERPIHEFQRYLASRLASA